MRIKKQTLRKLKDLEICPKDFSFLEEKRSRPKRIVVYTDGAEVQISGVSEIEIQGALEYKYDEAMPAVVDTIEQHFASEEELYYETGDERYHCKVTDAFYRMDRSVIVFEFAIAGTKARKIN